jgi:acyl-CoA thioester hydrolase
MSTPLARFTFDLTVAPSAIDANGHANNVEFVRWMQDAAVAHADAAGCTAATLSAAGGAWVVRSHRIEYLRPAFAGDRLAVVTWVADFRRAFSLRKYEFVRPVDNLVLARGETDWVYVDSGTGRPRSIPDPIRAMFEIPGPDGGS